MIKNKKIFSFFCQYLIPVSLFFIFFFLFFNNLNYYKFSILLGWVAYYLLCVILFVKPLSTTFKKTIFLKKILPLRKEIGILMFWTFLVHFLGTSIQKNLFSNKFFKIILDPTHYLFWGILAGLIIFILGITSNRLSIKKLNKLVFRGWKKLHYLVYLGFIFTTFHIYLINQNIIFLIILTLFIILKIIEFRK